MPSVNKTIILGNLGRDPEVRFTPNGSAVCNLNVATTRSWKNKETGDKVEETEWHRVVLYDRLAEIAGEYLRKGRAVYVEGRLKTRKWTDKEGIERYTTEVVAEQMQLMGSAADSAGPGTAPAPAAAPRASAPAPAPASSGVVRTPAKAAVPSRHDEFAGDIPF